jgi:hypothetical protein
MSTGEQKSPIFLLDVPRDRGGFSPASDAIRCANAAAAQAGVARQRDKNRLEADRGSSTRSRALLPAIDLTSSSASRATSYRAGSEAGQLVQAERDQAALAEQLAAVARHDLQAHAAPIAAGTAPTESLENLRRLARGETDLSHRRLACKHWRLVRSGWPTKRAATLIAGLTNLATAERDELAANTRHARTAAGWTIRPNWHGVRSTDGRQAECNASEAASGHWPMSRRRAQ